MRVLNEFGGKFLIVGAFIVAGAISGHIGSCFIAGLLFAGLASLANSSS